MFKNLVEFVHEEEGKVCRFITDHDANLEFVKRAIFEIGKKVGLVEDKIKELMQQQAAQNASSDENKVLKDFLNSKNLIPERLLLTHGHIDHILGNRFVFDNSQIHPSYKSDSNPTNSFYHCD